MMRKKVFMDDIELRMRLQDEVRLAGIRRWCKLHKAPVSSTHQFMTGRRGPSRQVLKALGYEYMRTIYWRVS